MHVKIFTLVTRLVTNVVGGCRFLTTKTTRTSKAGWWNGRHTGLKILCLEMGVRVRAPLRLLDTHHPGDLQGFLAFVLPHSPSSRPFLGAFLGAFDLRKLLTLNA